MSLENRVTPNASYLFQNGNLTVTGDNTSNTIVVTGQTGNAQLYVVQGLLQYGSPAFYAALNPANLRFNGNLTGSLTITGGNSADLLVVLVDDGASMPGNVTVRSGNGADDIIIASNDTVNPNALATIPGMLTLNGGLGADNISIIGMNVQGMTFVDGGGTGFRPGVINNPAPGDVFRIFVSTMGANVQVTNSITALDDLFGPSTIQGSLIVNNQAASPMGGFFINTVQYPAGYVNFGDPGYSGLLVIDAGSTVERNVVYSGSVSTDGVFVLGTVFGDVTFVGGAGNNDFFIGSGGAYPAQSATINGNVSFVGQSGIDALHIFDGSSVLAGSLNANMGDGNNLYNLDHFFNVNGNFQITAGNGDDNVGNVSGIISGNQFYNLGNGNNTLVWNGFAGVGQFYYQGGGGVDNVTINGVNAFTLRVYLGAGNDFFTYGLNAQVASALIDMGTGTNVYDGSQTTVTWPQTLIP
jgi:hypothetical protein